jgi:hypothetical protein
MVEDEDVVIYRSGTPGQSGRGPIGPLPLVLAAGSYTITVPGPVDINVRSGAGPPNGGGPAPTVHETVTQSCPKYGA